MSALINSLKKALDVDPTDWETRATLVDALVVEGLDDEARSVVAEGAVPAEYGPAREHALNAHNRVGLQMAETETEAEPELAVAVLIDDEEDDEVVTAAVVEDDDEGEEVATAAVVEDVAEEEVIPAPPKPHIRSLSDPKLPPPTGVGVEKPEPHVPAPKPYVASEKEDDAPKDETVAEESEADHEVSAVMEEGDGRAFYVVETTVGGTR